MKTKKQVGIIDYGAGNLGSIYNAIQYHDVPVKIISSPKNLNQFSHLILPGVGSFGTLSDNLKKKNWPAEIKKFVKQGKNLLGVCVGMQLLFEKSEESKGVEGLNLIKGSSCWAVPSTCIKGTSALKIKNKNNYIFYIRK